MLTMRVGQAIAPPSGRASRIREWIPVALLLVTGICNGVLYESVALDERARMIIAVNFFLSTAAILFCLRKNLSFSRRHFRSFRKRGQRQLVFIPSLEPDQEESLLPGNNGPDKRVSELSPDEVFKYANTFLN